MCTIALIGALFMGRPNIHGVATFFGLICPWICICQGFYYTRIMVTEDFENAKIKKKVNG